MNRLIRDCASENCEKSIPASEPSPSADNNQTISFPFEGAFLKNACSTLTGIWCPKEIRRRTKPAEPVILASYPGSGNTWLRHIIEISSGLQTGSEYCDSSLSKVFLGECTMHHPSNFSVFKSHFPYFGDYRDKRFFPPGSVFHKVFQRAIVIIRDPKEALLSEYKRSIIASHVADLEPEKFNPDDWLRYVRRMSAVWVQYITYWEKYPGDKLYVLFDNMKDRMGTEVRRILEFLNESSDYEGCYLGQSDGMFKREKVGKNDPFKAEHLKFMEEQKALPLYRKIRERELYAK